MQHAVTKFVHRVTIKNRCSSYVLRYWFYFTIILSVTLQWSS